MIDEIYPGDVFRHNRNETLWIVDAFDVEFQTVNIRTQGGRSTTIAAAALVNLYTVTDAAADLASFDPPPAADADDFVCVGIAIEPEVIAAGRLSMIIDEPPVSPYRRSNSGRPRKIGVPRYPDGRIIQPCRQKGATV